jgi:hypothetical protein
MISEQIGKQTLRNSQFLIIHGPGAQSQNFTLFLKRLNDPRMAVALIDSRVAGDEIKILLVVHVPDVRTTPARGNHRNGLVVVAAVNQFFSGNLEVIMYSMHSRDFSEIVCQYEFFVVNYSLFKSFLIILYYLF